MSNKYYSMDGPVLGMSGGIPVADMKIVSKNSGGILYHKMDIPVNSAVVEKFEIKKTPKRSNISTISKKKPQPYLRDAYLLFCAEITARKKREGRDFPIDRENKKVIWNDIKEMMQNGTMKPTKKDMRAMVNKIDVVEEY